MNLKILTGSYETYIFMAAALLLFGAIVYWHNASFTRSSKARRLVLFLKTVRTLAFLTIAFLSFNPSISYDKLESEKGAFLFIFDTSLSMSFLDSEGGAGRFESASSALVNSRAVEKIAEAHNVEFAAMAGELTPVKDLGAALKTVPGGATDISGALGALMQRNDITGALIVSDGRNTGEVPPESLAKYVKFPVFTLGTGAASSLKDTAITGVSYPKNAYLNEAAAIAADIACNGYPGAKTVLTLKENGEVKSRTPVSFDAARRQVKVPLKPSKAGLIKYELALAPLEGEITDQNNVFAFYINVTEHKIRILAVQNAPDADFSYMLKFFASGRDIKFTYKFLNTHSEKHLLKQADLDGGFDILILGNIDFTKLEPAMLKKFESVLDAGNSSVLFTGGPELAIPSEGPIAARFPFDMSGRSFAYEPARYRPAANNGAAAAQITKLSPIAKINSYMWNDIPELCGVNYLKNADGSDASEVPRGSDIVLYANFICPNSRRAVDTPILAARNAPGRKSAAILGGSFWFLKAGQLFSKNSAFYDKFFSNLILWLYSKEDYRAFKIETDRANYYEGERVFVSVNARNRDFSPMANPSFAITLGRGEKTEVIKPQVSMIDAGYYEFSFAAKNSGEQEITVAADDSGGKKDSMTARFIVLNSSKEMLDCTADYDCLKKISEKTGGKFYEKDNIASLFADIPKRGAERSVTVTFKPFENGAIFGLILILLCLEWAVRRYSGFE